MGRERSPLPEMDILKALVAQTDERAARNVRATRNRPFGASLHVYDPVSGRLTTIGAPATDTMLDPGSAVSAPRAQAPVNALRSEAVHDLKSTLRGLWNRSPSVILATNAESFMAGRAAMQIVAHHLERNHLLGPGRFYNVYGASLDHTAAATGLTDPAESRRVLMPNVLAPDRVPREIKQMFGDVSGPVAVVKLGDGTLLSGYDDRALDVTATAEVSAIRRAWHVQHQRGKRDAWNLDGATLYTHSHDQGPLAWAEAMQANVARWNAVPGAPHRAATETPGMENAALFALVATRPANGVQSVDAAGFDSAAQRAWAVRRPESIPPPPSSRVA